MEYSKYPEGFQKWHGKVSSEFSSTDRLSQSGGIFRCHWRSERHLRKEITTVQKNEGCALDMERQPLFFGLNWYAKSRSKHCSPCSTWMSSIKTSVDACRCIATSRLIKKSKFSCKLVAPWHRCHFWGFQVQLEIDKGRWSSNTAGTSFFPRMWLWNCMGYFFCRREGSLLRWKQKSFKILCGNCGTTLRHVANWLQNLCERTVTISR